MILLRHCFRCLHAVHGSRSNSACVSGAFSTWIQPLNIHTLHRFISCNSHRRGRPCLYAGKNRVVSGKSMDFLFKYFDPFLNGRCDLLREDSTYIAKAVRPFHLRKHLSKGIGNSSVFKISEALYRDLPVSCFICPLFQMSLEFHSGKRSLISICSVVFRCHSHDHGAVGIFSCSSMITHSIDTETAFLQRMR